MLRAVNALLPFEIYEAICYFCAINDMKMKKIKLFFAVFCTLVCSVCKVVITVRLMLR